MKKATQQQTKEHNRNLVFKTILEQESISRADIARATHLTRTTVSDIVAELIDEGLVHEVGIGSSTGGKSPILLSVVEDARTMIGLDLAQNQFSGAIVNLCGVLRHTISLPVNERDGEAALSLVYEILDQLVKVAGTSLVGIGVGTPGLVNPQAGIVINAVNLSWKDLPLAHLLRQRYHLPVRVLNDSQAAAMGEYTYGRLSHAVSKTDSQSDNAGLSRGYRDSSVTALPQNDRKVGNSQNDNAGLSSGYRDSSVTAFPQNDRKVGDSHKDRTGSPDDGPQKIEERRNLIVINARHGIGAGIVIDGQLFQGDGGGAGEIGHVVVVRENGLLCRCGNRGCLETVASAQAIVNRTRAQLPGQAPAITLDSVEAAFAAGDPLARQVVLEAASYMGLAISALVGMLNIQDIVLSGELTRFGTPWLEAIRETMLQTSLFGIASDTRVEIGKLDRDGIILGATALLASDYSLLFNPETSQFPA